MLRLETVVTLTEEDDEDDEEVEVTFDCVVV